MVDGEIGEKVSGDSDGFQEVKSKKNVKDRKIDEKPQNTKKPEKDLIKDRKTKGPSSQLSQQQIANIPPLMGTPINPPPIIPQGSSNKNYNRKNLPPRLQPKNRENEHLQKQQMQQNIYEVNDVNKLNQSMNMYSMKDSSNVVSSPITNAWEKPLTNQLRSNLDQDNILGVGLDNVKGIEQSQSTGQNHNSGTDKVSFYFKYSKSLLCGNLSIFFNTFYGRIDLTQASYTVVRELTKLISWIIDKLLKNLHFEYLYL